MSSHGITAAKHPNLEKLTAYINSQPNPRAFASALLAIAALRPTVSTMGLAGVEKSTQKQT